MSSENSTELRREVDSIGAVLDALESLPGPSRERVIEYVVRALAIGGAVPIPRSSLTVRDSEDELAHDFKSSAAEPQMFTGIRSLTEAKQPRTAMEMAAVVAYFMSELAPSSDRSNVITAADLQKYFKLGGFPLPQKIDMTLVNAAAAGYFDRVDVGKYRLNPVGYNLVVHNLPSGSSETTTGRRVKRKSPAKRTAKKIPAKKPAVAKKKTVAAKKIPAKKTVAAKKVPAKNGAAKEMPSLSEVFRGSSAPLT